MLRGGVQLVEAQAVVADMDQRALGQMKQCTYPVHTDLSSKYVRSVRRQRGRDADRTDRESSLVSRQMDAAEAWAEKAGGHHQRPKSRSVTEAGS